MKEFIHNNKVSFYFSIGTLLLVTMLMFTFQVWAAPDQSNAVPGVISYQGYITDSNGQPVNTTTDMIIRIYNVTTGGTALWEEVHTGGNAVPVNNGYFNLYLGSLTPIPDSVWDNNPLYLGVQVGADAEMMPREVIGSVPFALRAQVSNMALTVSDGAITTDKLADGSVTTDKLAAGMYHVGHNGDEEKIYFEGPDGIHTYLYYSSCDEGWCTNAENMIGYYHATGERSRLAFNLAGTSSYACTLLSHDDDAAWANDGVVFATEINASTPKPFTSAFFISNENKYDDNLPIRGHTEYYIFCP